MLNAIEIGYYLRTLAWLVVGSFLVYILNIFCQKWKNLKMAYKFDGPEDMSFLFGHLEALIQPSDMHYKNMRALCKKYYPHFRMRVLLDTSINILAPEDCELVMGSKKHSRKSNLYFVLKNWLKDGLLLSSGEKWMQRRKILTPAFHFNILKDFVSIFNEETDNLVNIIMKNCSEPIDVVPLVSRFALNSINETAMGTKLDTGDKNQKRYRDAINNIEEIFRNRMMKPWQYITSVYYFTKASKTEHTLLKVLHKFTKSVIRTRMNKFKGISNFTKQTEESEDEVYMNKKKKRLAMLDILLQARQDGGQINYEGICEEVDTFMFEGHDTTSVAISFCMMLIANHPKIQEHVDQEIKSVLGEERKMPNYSELQKMDLLERCIKESLRLYPSVHSISRLADEDIVLNSGLVVPKDIDVHIHIIDIHRNPKIFPDPEKFDPDRFLPDNCQNRHPFAYIPFSAGPRNCIGQRFAMLEMKVVLIGILQSFKLIAIDTPETIVLKSDLILRTQYGIKVKFEPRNSRLPLLVQQD